MKIQATIEPNVSSWEWAVLALSSSLQLLYIVAESFWKIWIISLVDRNKFFHLLWFAIFGWERAKFHDCMVQCKAIYSISCGIKTNIEKSHKQRNQQLLVPILLQKSSRLAFSPLYFFKNRGRWYQSILYINIRRSHPTIEGPSYIFPPLKTPPVKKYSMVIFFRAIGTSLTSRSPFAEIIRLSAIHQVFAEFLPGCFRFR